MRYKIFLLLIILSSILNAYEIKVISIEFPPYAGLSEPYNGISFRIMNEAFKDTQFKIKPVFNPPLRVQKSLNNYPVSLYSFPEMNNIKHFKQVHSYNVIYTFYYNKNYGNIQWENLADLSGKTFGEIRFTDSDNHIKETLKSAGLVKKESNSLEHLILMLKKGRIDLVLCVDLTAKMITESLFPNEDVIVPTDKVFLMIKGGPWFNLNHPKGTEIMNIYKTSIERMKRDGTLLQIFEEYYEKNNVPAYVIE